MSVLTTIINFYLNGVKRLVNGSRSVYATSNTKHEILFAVYLAILTGVTAIAFIPYTLWKAITGDLATK